MKHNSQSVNNNQGLSVGRCLTIIKDILSWIVFKVFLPGFPFFLAVFIDHFFVADFHEKASIVIQSDILILGFSLAVGVFDSGNSYGKSIGRGGTALMLTSLMILVGLFFVLYFPSIGYVFHFKSMELERVFWIIIVSLCMINIAYGIYIDIFKKES